jgi:hypothetical protein
MPLVGIVKYGAYFNYWIEFAASTVTVAAVAVHAGLSVPARGWVPPALSVTAVLVVIVQLIRLAPGVETEWSAWSTADATRRADGSAAEFQPLVERVRAEPGAVLADPMDVVVLADRPVLLEPVLFSLFELDGRWSSAPLVRRICAGDVSLLVLNRSLESIGPMFGEPVWPPSVLTALRQRMAPAGRMADRYLYTPSPHGSCQATAAGAHEG